MAKKVAARCIYVPAHLFASVKAMIDGDRSKSKPRSIKRKRAFTPSQLETHKVRACGILNSIKQLRKVGGQVDAELARLDDLIDGDRTKEDIAWIEDYQRELYKLLDVLDELN